jgi:RNA polymerase sigma-70 factor (ECF subfamily)
MPGTPDDTAALQGLLLKLQAGSPEARELLLARSCRRLEALSRKMLHSDVRVARWEQTGDVLQGALLRLTRALEKIHPKDVRGYFRLAGKLIRQELIDLARKHLGPEGAGSKHESVEVGKLELVPQRQRASSDLHEAVESLPAEELEVVDLIIYQNMTAKEAALALAASERTVKRRWRSARLRLQERLGRSEEI